MGARRKEGRGTTRKGRGAERRAEGEKVVMVARRERELDEQRGWRRN
jgi:hypothetical protein